jgi:hypothetical protein
MARIKQRTEQDFDEKYERLMIIRRSPSPPTAPHPRTLSGSSEPSTICADYESYRRFHSQPPIPPAVPSPPSSPPFGSGDIVRDDPGPWFQQNHQPYETVAYSERGNSGSPAQAWWGSTDSETVTSVNGEHRTYVDVRDEVVHDDMGRRQRQLVVEETTRLPNAPESQKVKRKIKRS